MTRLILFFLKIVTAILSLFPRSWVRGVGSILGWLWIDVFRIRMKVIKDNLEIAFPEKTQKEKHEIARTSVYNMGANFIEMLTTPSLDEKWLKKNIVFEGYENLEKARSLNKGVYLLGMHLGNGDITGTALAMKGQPIFLITKTFRNKIVNSIWFHFRGAQGVKYIEAHGEKTAFEILRAIKSKSLVVFVLDQFMGRPFAVETTFFGRKTGTAYGLALFYLKTKSPIVPVYAYEGPGHRLHVVTEPALELESLVTSDQDKSILNLTQRFCDVIEEAIIKHPKDWMWVHRRWKEYE